jgi:hypothetical protein
LETGNQKSQIFSFLPPEVIANNLLSIQKEECGEIRNIFAPGQLARVEYCNPADKPYFASDEKAGTARFVEDPTRTHFLPGLRLFGLGASIPAITPPADPNALSPAETPAESKPDFKGEKLEAKALTSEELAAAVERYTVRRAGEYVAYARNITPWPHRHSPPKFITEDRHCPCGHASPCPHHETSEKCGPFPDKFWSLSPFDSAYADHLAARDLPYRRPTEFLA